MAGRVEHELRWNAFTPQRICQDVHPVPVDSGSFAETTP